LRKLLFFKLALLVGVLAAFFGLIQLLENVFQLFALFSGFQFGHFLLLLLFLLRPFGLFRLLLGLFHHFLLVLGIRPLGRRRQGLEFRHVGLFLLDLRFGRL